MRPSTAKSTIRAIAPSPPPSLTEAMRLNYASTGTPDPNSLPDEQTVMKRPKSDGFHEAYIHGEDLGVAVPAEAGSVVGLGRSGGTGDVIMRRSSPVKRRSRSTSPVKKRRTVFQHTAPGSQQPETPNKQKATERQEEEQNPYIQVDAAQDRDDSDASSDTDTEYPDTPTPMTTSQKRSAYLPLGTPTPPSVPHSKRSSKAKSKASASSLNRTRTPGTDTTAPLPPDQSFRHVYSHAGPAPPRCADNARSMTQARKGRLGNEHMIRRPEVASRQPQLRSRGTPLELQRFTRTNNYDVSKKNTSVVSKVNYLYPPQPNRRPPAPPAPLVDRYGNVCYPAPAVVPGRNTSLSRISATSNGTVASRKSVFSTLGRDELERKKAFVEADEGPFARAVSMQDLNQSRRVISGEVKKDRDVGGKEERTKCGCVVM